jgi:hypothetical protein
MAPRTLPTKANLMRK